MRGDSDSEEDDPMTPSTTEFIKDAVDTGFTLDLLSRAEHSLDSGKNPTSSDLRLPKTIISTMVQKKLAGVPWQGPLPEAPPRTLGDFLAKATHRSPPSRWLRRDRELATLR
jgi:hypothetical protein